ncbi:MAG: TonB-dependent receptor [Clostridium sp.]|nr:TonB-dependent receptor [Bacteroides sp.]MCM1197356.1 TonB-dependent receptor [Clostridium sp.]
MLKSCTYLFAAMLAIAPLPAFAAVGREPLHVEAGSSDGIVLKGTVVDASTSEPLPGVTVRIKGTLTGTDTDVDGNFTIAVPDGSQDTVLEIFYLGYTSCEVTAKDGVPLIVRLAEENQMLEEVQVIAYGKQSKMSVTGSIASVGTDQLLRSPSGSVANALSGAVTGVSSVQVSGEPGAESPSIYIRGTGSLTDAASAPLILVDGVERDFFSMDPNEIESVTVLKDASSTAVFGVRGANGVILVTTRRGDSGKPHISWTSQAGMTQSLRNLSGVDSYTYASLYNAAQLSDNPDLSPSKLMFSPFVVEMFRTGEDPVMFPDVDWNKYIFKDYSYQTQHNLTVSGGGERFRYFASLGYLYQDGMLRRYYETYDPNYTYSRYNYRVNLDVDVTETTLLKFNIGGHAGKKNEPVTDNLWRNVMWTVPFASPGFVDGKQITNYNNKYLNLSAYSGLDYYYDFGYRSQTSNVLNIDLSLEQKLDFVTKGLSAQLKGAYNSNYSVTVTRGTVGTDSKYTPIYLGSVTQPGMDVSDPRFDRTIVYQTDGVSGLDEPMSYSSSLGKGRNWYAEFSISYARTFGKHEVTGLLLYNQSKTYYPEQYVSIPTGYVGYVARATYSYDKRYMIDLNAGYNGSENFAPGNRYGFFPSVSAGWIISEEKFMKHQRAIDFLKLRASYGLVGNDKYSGARFLYLAGSWNGNNSTWEQNGSYQFGSDAGNVLLPDAKENTMGNPDVTWEKCAKQNYGLDLKLLNYRLSLTADVFFENRTDILSTRNTLPSIADINLPLINLGQVKNHGYELSLGWTDKARSFEYSVVANMSYSKNRIIYMDEVVPNYPYMAQTGLSTGLVYGYLFDRFLAPDDFAADGTLKTDADGSPLLPVMPVGNPRPGDALYRDLNGDHVIDGNDKTWFGYSSRPDYVFGLVANLGWKGFGFSMQWTGALHASRMLSGEYRNSFGSTNNRMLLKFLADGSWTEERQDARFPRLTFQNKSHNIEASDLWLMDASYLRLKTAELSYTFNTDSFPGLRRAGISSLKMFVSGYNLLTLFSELNDIDIDPEGNTAGDTNTYPNVRIFNLGFNISF